MTRHSPPETDKPGRAARWVHLAMRSHHIGQGARRLLQGEQPIFLCSFLTPKPLGTFDATNILMLLRIFFATWGALQSRRRLALTRLVDCKIFCGDGDWSLGLL